MGYAGEGSYASVMFHDAVLAFEFEYDFHPTARIFHIGPTDGSWEAGWRFPRTWANDCSGRATFPLRSLIPETMDGLIVAQKNLGFSSVVSSALRLHDQSTAVGQAAGAAAIVALSEEVDPRDIPWSADLMAAVWTGLLNDAGGAAPMVLWHFADLDPFHAAFVAVNQLGVRQLLNTAPTEQNFSADTAPSAVWLDSATTMSTSTSTETISSPGSGDSARCTTATIC